MTYSPRCQIAVRTLPPGELVETSADERAVPVSGGTLSGRMVFAGGETWSADDDALAEIAAHMVSSQIEQFATQEAMRRSAVGEERIRKVRAMLIRRELLEDFPYHDSLPLLENSWHADRIKTLRAAAALFHKEPDNFLTLEVCV